MNYLKALYEDYKQNGFNERHAATICGTIFFWFEALMLWAILTCSCTSDA